MIVSATLGEGAVQMSKAAATKRVIDVVCAHFLFQIALKDQRFALRRERSTPSAVSHSKR
uniref:Uncharacterized protein n=1 Tax=Rhizobium rhizogenes TaxID=359 RepID=A0A7S5DSY7_RHIRH|nr:hypothetical protein pC6.5b_433 [Rhizobium rhizogenes]QCL10482.1 hypothetical protein pC6.5c_589 [Rhizobium rhizogenes]